MSSTEDRYACVDWVEKRMIQRSELANGEIIFRFIVAKSNLDSGDLVLGVEGCNLIVRNGYEGSSIESEVLGNEGNGAACPGSSVN